MLHRLLGPRFVVQNGVVLVEQVGDSVVLGVRLSLLGARGGQALDIEWLGPVLLDRAELLFDLRIDLAQNWIQIRLLGRIGKAV